MKRRVIRGFAAGLTAIVLLVGPSVAGGGAVASARGICIRGHCYRASSPIHH